MRVLLAACVLRAVGLTWGLPSSDGWDCDGIAPRDFLVGLVESFTPGHYYTYPPFHLALLGLLTLPVTVIALLRSDSLRPEAIVPEIIHVPYMTAYAVIARVVTAVMSLVLIYLVAKIAEEIGGKRAGIWAAVVACLSCTLTYYSHTTNLDVPYLFWAFLSLLTLVRAMARDNPRALVRAAIYAALAVVTKDQGFALFVLTVPLVTAAWVWLERRQRPPTVVLLATAKGLLIATVIVLLVNGAATNPSGFARRVEFLIGPASQDFANYSRDARGRLMALSDVATRFSDHYAWVFAIPVTIGVVVCIARRGVSSRERIIALLPLVAALSFSLFFNMSARRTEDRFLLPQAVLWAIYAGVGLQWLQSAARPKGVRYLGALLGVVCVAYGTYDVVSLDLNLTRDPRYDAEAWLQQHAALGDTVEVHGLNVYLPRVWRFASVRRVGPEPLHRRNPLPGVQELVDNYENVGERRPTWIVVSHGFAWRYQVRPGDMGESGRIYAPTILHTLADAGARQFFQGLEDQTLGYTVAHKARWTSSVWRRFDIHASTVRDVTIYRRAGD